MVRCVEGGIWEGTEEIKVMGALVKGYYLIPRPRVKWVRIRGKLKN